MTLKQKYMLLKNRIPILMLIGMLIIAIAIISISFSRYEKININKHISMADGMTDLMVKAFDTSKCEEYIEENYTSKDYNEVLKYYYYLKKSFPEVTYVYVYKFYINEEGQYLGEVIMDLDEEYTEDVPQESIDWIGDNYVVDDVFKEDIASGLYKKQAVWHIVESDVTDDTKGRLISYIKPIIDANGEYVCSACVDFSLDTIYGNGIDFIIELLGVISLIMFLALAVLTIMLNRILFKPLEGMIDTIKSFKYATAEDRYDNLRKIQALNINVKNELDSLYQTIVLSTKDNAFYMSNLQQVQGELKEVNEIVSKDALTGVQSKSAYNSMVDKINSDIVKGKTAFAVVMIDINNLKYVNDTFGHEHGDAYIKGCAKIICEVFKKAPVFRIGGDEFVAILRNDLVEQRNELVELAQQKFNEIYNDVRRADYERYTASLGTSSFQKRDTQYMDVFNRADKNMYDAKTAFKKEHGSYR